MGLGGSWIKPVHDGLWALSAMNITAIYPAGAFPHSASVHVVNGEWKTKSKQQKYKTCSFMLVSVILHQCADYHWMSHKFKHNCELRDNAELLHKRLLLTLQNKTSTIVLVICLWLFLQVLLIESK